MGSNGKLNFRRIVLSGIPGADWDEESGGSFDQLFSDRLEKDFGIKARIYSIRERIYAFADEERMPLDPGKIHRSSEEKIQLLRRLAFLDVERDVRASGSIDGDSITLINTRATSYSAHGREEALSKRYLENIRPDLFVVLIDDPVSIFNRISKREETRKYAELGLDDIIRWMEGEVSKMHELAGDLKCPLFVIPRRQIGALVELICTDKPPAYASYMMTSADESIKEKTRIFVENLKKYFVVFDPVCMGTAHVQSPHSDQEQAFYRDNVKKRDEQWFIGINSKYVVVYLPCKGPAHGSQSELDAASEKGKTVWVVLEPSYSDELGRLTPFIDQPSDLVFVSSDEFSYFLALGENARSGYMCVAKAMWGFKRRGNLQPLMQKPTNGWQKTMEQVHRDFGAEALKKCEGQVKRAIFPALQPEKLGEMIDACWDFNKQLWEANGVQSPTLQLFEEPESELLAARSTDLQRPPRRVGGVAQHGSSEHTSTALTDQEVFTGVFGPHATGANGTLRYEALRSFTGENELGTLGRNIAFLRFLKQTLDVHRYRSPRILNPDNLNQWFREFNSGEVQGSRL